MIWRLFKSRYIGRHNILDVLVSHQKANYSPNNMPGDIELSVSEIEKKTGLNREEIWNHIDVLLNEGEIYSDEDESSRSFGSTNIGAIAIFERKYHKIARKEFFEENFDLAKTISTWILLFIAVVSFVYTTLETKKNRNDINTLENELKALRDSVTHGSK